jgi:uncharacterized protein YegL
MTPVDNITLNRARPLPVIILADASGSMNPDGKIDVLNSAISEMLGVFAREENLRAEIQVCVVAFGGDNAEIHIPLAPAGKVRWTALSAGGKTPLGGALRCARAVIEDEALVPSRAYRPTVVLVSDGEPNDDWNEALAEFKSSPRSAKAMRMALGIGADANVGVLEAFADGSGTPVFRASDVPEITKFFRLVTMTVTARSQSVMPNELPPLAATSLEELDF